MEKGKMFAGITQNLNRILNKSLQSFSNNTEWTDINNWLLTLQSVLKDYPSPYINEKVLLSKRLNQCMNPILPDKIHECVLRIHDIIFSNMRIAADGNINDYIKMFADDLGVYSVSILPYFSHTSVKEHRLMVLRLIKEYYLDLGKQLIPIVPGFLKSILPVYTESVDERLSRQIQSLLDQIVKKVGRKYVIGIMWSTILKFTDCKAAGMKYLGLIIKKMDFIKGEEEFSESHGFSEEEQEIRREQMAQLEKQQKQDKTNVKVRKLSSQSHPKTKMTNQLETPINQLDHQDRHSEKHKRVNQFDISPDGKYATSQGQMISEDRLNQVDHLNQQQKFLRGIQEVSENQVDSDPQHNKQIPRNIDRANTKHLYDSVGFFGSVDTPKLANEDYLTTNKAFSSAQNFDDLVGSSSIKLNKVPVMTTPGIQSIKQGIDSDRQENNFPNSNTLVVSALISCVQEESQVIKRAALDFMFSHLRIKSQILEENDRKLLVEALVGLYKRKQISISKRANRWLFGKEDEENRYNITEKNQFVIEYIINAFKKILQKQPTTQEDCIIPIKILQNFYIDHPHMVQMTLGQISIDVLRYIFNFGTKSKLSINDQKTQFAEIVLKAGKRFLQNLPTYYPVIFKSLGQDYIKAIQNNDEQMCFQAVKYADFCYIHLMKHQHGLQELQYITLTLESLCKGLNMLAEKQSFKHLFLKQTVLLIYNLVARRSSVQRFNKKQLQRVNDKYFEQTGQMELPPERIKYQKELHDSQQKQQSRYIVIMKDLQKFFTGIGHYIKTIPNITIYQEAYKVASLAMVKVQTHLPRQGLKQLPQWFTTIQQGIKMSNPVVSLASIQAMIKILMWEGDHPIYNSLKQILMQQKNKKVGNDYQKQALQKLWALLDYPHMHTKIIDLIVVFSKFFPYQFTETVKRSFTTINAAQKQASIQRFSHFWRLTGFKYKQLLASSRQFQQLNKVGLFMMLDFLDDTNPLVRHAAKNWLMESIPLFNRIIQPLLHELIKNCSDWYETPKGTFLIQNVYDTGHVFNTIRRIKSILSTGSYVVLRYIYQTQISQSLDQLRAKISKVQGPFLTQNIKQGPDLTQSYFDRQPVLPKALQNQLTNQVEKKSTAKMAYFDLMMILVLKFIEGHTIESMGIQFYIGNSGVNASAVQFLQTLIDYIDNPKLCQKIINFIISPLFRSLKQVVLNREYIMQIQILGILNKVFFTSSFRKKAESSQIRAFFKNVFTDKNFLLSTLQGLSTPFAYVRSQFINFLTICIPLIADFLEPQQCTQSIRHIIFTYYRIIKQLRVNLLTGVLQQEEKIANQMDKKEQQNNFQQNLLLSRVVQLQDQLRKQQKYVKLTDNLSQIAKTNQILSVLHGLSSILNYFFDLNKLNIDELSFQFTNPYTFFDTFKSIITLGLASSEKDGKIIQRIQFLHNTATCEAILEDLTPVYETVLRSWPLSEQYVRISTEEFSSIGMKLFNFEKFSSYNKIVRELIVYVQQQQESIWGKIFSIMQPMFFRFPKQITDIYLKLWIRQCDDLLDHKEKENQGFIKLRPNAQKTQFLMKIIETIIVNNFPMKVVVHAVLQSTVIEQLKTYYDSSKKENVLNYEINKTQSKLLFFLYVYINYIHLNETQMTKDKLLQVWSLIMKVLRPFERSKNPLVSIWILEILNLAARKYSPKQLLYNEKFKHDLHRLINDKLKFIASVASRKEHFFFRDPMTKINFNQQQDEITIQYDLVLPLPPTIYEIYKLKRKDRSDTDKELLKTVKPGDNMELEVKYRIYCFKTLKKLGLQILQNTYLPEKMHWVIVRSTQWLDIILPTIQDKSPHNMIFAECASQILYDILDKARILFIKSLKPKVLAIFNKDDFFICNANTLNYWAKIIDWIVSVDKYNQTFAQYLQKVSLSSSYFGNENEENKKRIKSFERICFILYSGSKDKYSQKITGLLQKISDVIKMSETAHPALLILILFAIRILILRLSEICLNQLFIDIWPMILALLMQIFSKQYVKVNLTNQVSKNPNLLLASLKLIEMISLTNLGQFAHHQWIFIYDYFGLKLSVPQMTTQINQFVTSRPELSDIIQINRVIKSSPFIYKPYLFSHLPVSTSINYSSKKKEDSKMEFVPKKRKIIVKNSFVEGQAQLKVQALFLMQYFNYIGQYRTSVDWEQIQNVIVEDFIKLDSFIHQIK